MKPEWCTQDAWDEADRLADVSSKYWHDIYWNGQSDITLNEHVARALLEAHQRGKNESQAEIDRLIEAVERMQATMSSRAEQGDAVNG